MENLTASKRIRALVDRIKCGICIHTYIDDNLRYKIV
jgi:hypothetical protein